MKSKEEIEKAIAQCSVAQETWDAKLCPIWPKDADLYCHDCTCRTSLRWVLEIEG